MQCGANDRDLAAVLLQEGRPLAYASRALTNPETQRWKNGTNVLIAATFL